MFKRLISSALVFGMAALAPPAAAQVFCLPRPVAAQQLSTLFGEMPLVIGIGRPQQTVEFWARPEGGSWTLLVTTADGMSCVMASGPEWMPGFADPASPDPAS